MNNVNISTTTETRVTDVQADVDFTLHDDRDLADVITDVLLAQLKGHTSLQQGNYNVRLLLVVTEAGE